MAISFLISSYKVLFTQLEREPGHLSLVEQINTVEQVLTPGVNFLKKLKRRS